MLEIKNLHKNVKLEELLKRVILLNIHEKLWVDWLLYLVLPYKLLDANYIWCIRK